MPERGADQHEYSAIQPPPATRLHLPLPGVLTAGVSLAVDPLRGLTGEEVDTEGAATGAALGSGTNTGGRASPSARGNFTPDTAGKGRRGEQHQGSSAPSRCEGCTVIMGRGNGEREVGKVEKEGG